MNQVEIFRKKLRSNQLMIGTHVSLSDASVTEIFGEIGFDYVWIDGEHTLLTGSEIKGHLIAAKATNTLSLVRVACSDPVLAKPLMDAGADGIIFPYIVSVPEARRAVKACAYPPVGTRGYGPNRAMKYGLVRQEDYIERDSDNIFTVLQIEHENAVKQLDEILEIEGIDAVIVGAQDLSASVGMLGQVKAGEMTALFDRIAEAALRHGVPFGISCGPDPEFIRQWIERGAKMISVEMDYGFIVRGALELKELLLSTYDQANR